MSDSYKRLSDEIINKYDYQRTKKNVDSFMAPLCEKIFVYRNLTPPSITNHIKDVCVQESYSTTSGTEKYVIKKLDTEAEVEEYFKAIQEVIDMLNEPEKICFKAEYLSEITLEKLLEKTTYSEPTIKRIRKSAVIKFALALDLAVLKRRK